MSDYPKEREKISKLFKEKTYLIDFEEVALQVFRFQFEYNKVYQSYCNHLGMNKAKIQRIEEIPFLPIQFFKKYEIKTGGWKEDVVFRSSGTTQDTRSKHFIYSMPFYLENALDGFEKVYGDVEQYCILAILPGYQERSDSSLIHMVQTLINKSQHMNSGFYLGQEEDMLEVIKENDRKEIPTILFGVSFGLLDFTRYKLTDRNLIVIETGGMKTSRLEMTKEEIIRKFKNAWANVRVDSEYGMTELQSQAYAQDSEWYSPMHTMRVFIGQLHDPFVMEEAFRVGSIKVVDLANFDSCSFIETEDLGMHDSHGAFQVLGRMNNAELRGCNLLLENIQ